MKNRFSLYTCFALCLGLLGAASPARADLVGTTATVSYDYPTLGTVLYPGGTMVIASGGTVFPIASGYDPVVVNGSTLLLTFDLGWDFADDPSKTFDGIVLTDPTANIIAVSLAATNIDGFTAAYISSDANDVYIDFPNSFTSLPAGSDVLVNIISASPTPEPSGWLLLGTGMLAGAFCYRRRLFA